MNTRFPVILLFAVFVLSNCREEKPTVQADFEVNLRLKADPKSINPVLADGYSVAREVYQYLFLNLAEINPVSLKIEPVLAEEIPDLIKNEDGTVELNIVIRDDAVWSNGDAITGHDFDFTVKLAMHPKINCPSWKSVLVDILSVSVDADDPRKFKIKLQDSGLGAKEGPLSMEILPEYHYDPSRSLRKYAIDQIGDLPSQMNQLETDSLLEKTVNDFNRSNIEGNIVGTGPYSLSKYEPDQYVILERQKDWWAGSTDHPILHAIPSKINFHIIPDEATAQTQLKSGGLDFMYFRLADLYQNLKKNESVKNQINFGSVQLQRYYFLGLNNQSVKLEDAKVRKALSHLMDVDNVIETMEYGEGVRLASPILPWSADYNDKISLPEYDITLANQLLDDAAWIDSNNNGIRDKNINGNIVELILRIFVTNGKLGQKVGLLLKEAAEKAGVKIEIVTQKYSVTKSQNINKGDYEIVALLGTAAHTDYDPYSRYHSDNIGNGGTNTSRFANEEADLVIDQIRSEVTKEERRKLYLQFQEILHDQTPAIFLYAPKERFAFSSDITPLLSNNRPGYFANCFEPKS